MSDDTTKTKNTEAQIQKLAEEIEYWKSFNKGMEKAKGVIDYISSNEDSDEEDTEQESNDQQSEEQSEGEAESSYETGPFEYSDYTGTAPVPGMAGRASSINRIVKVVRSQAQKSKYLQQLLKSGRAPKWMTQWLSNGKVPPGHQVDHRTALSAGGKDVPGNMRLKTTADHRIRHKFYRPWKR